MRYLTFFTCLTRQYVSRSTIESGPTKRRWPSLFKSHAHTWCEELQLRLCHTYPLSPVSGLGFPSSEYAYHNSYRYDRNNYITALIHRKHYRRGAPYGNQFTHFSSFRAARNSKFQLFARAHLAIVGLCFTLELGNCWAGVFFPLAVGQ